MNGFGTIATRETEGTGHSNCQWFAMENYKFERAQRPEKKGMLM
jgi:hypothetical protein